MTAWRPIRYGVILLLVAILPISSALPQQQTAIRSDDETVKEETRLYADAHPYLDEALPQLKKAVHELAALQPIPSQEQPPDLLAKIGAKADELLGKVPDLISDEEVSQSQYSASQGNIPGCTGAACTAGASSSEREQKYSYLLLTHPAADGDLRLQEYRTGENGKPIRSGTGGPNFQGFIAAWVIFSSANQVESRFHYLGQQQTDGHSTFVVGFAQVPGLVESPGLILTDAEPVPMLLQGVAWVDQGDFRIVRLRTDLLASRPEVQIRKQTANILFGPVHIAGIGSELWLPRSVQVEMDARGQLFQEHHKYSKYRLYRSESRIIVSPNN